MEKSELLRVLEISETIAGSWTGIDLKKEVQKIGKYLVQESRGKIPRENWVDKSLSALKPVCREEAEIHCREMIQTYESVLDMYKGIKGDGNETYNMKRFVDKIGFWYRYLKMMYSAKTVDESK